ncbi:MAG: RluA family pseudouridine synthase [Treponema sp.]|nr:RluA family pseudouridine synthase [Treponema sp.]
MKNLKILYEDDYCLVIDKPAGLAVQGGQGVKSSVDMILAEMRSPPPLLVHRLDKDTSGALLTAKTKEYAARFSRLLGADRQAEKYYIAVCAGSPPKKEGIISQDLMIRGSLKKAETRYKVLKSGDFSVLELSLGTGRMHQIRRHLAMNGNPVLGDDKYGDFALNKKLRKEAGLKRLLLHSSRLVIKVEFQLDVSAPMPDYFEAFLAVSKK